MQPCNGGFPGHSWDFYCLMSEPVETCSPSVGVKVPGWRLPVALGKSIVACQLCYPYNKHKSPHRCQNRDPRERLCDIDRHCAFCSSLVPYHIPVTRIACGAADVHLGLQPAPPLRTPRGLCSLSLPHSGRAQKASHPELPGSLAAGSSFSALSKDLGFI